ncbi:MAG: HesB/IscA family protein [Rhodothermales bacterium]
MNIQITDRAIGKIREIAQQEQIDFADTMLRVAVVPGGCSGLTYDLGWDTTEQEGDAVTELDGVRVVMDRRSRRRLRAGLHGRSRRQGFPLPEPTGYAHLRMRGVVRVVGRGVRVGPDKSSGQSREARDFVRCGNKSSPAETFPLTF